MLYRRGVPNVVNVLLCTRHGLFHGDRYGAVEMSIMMVMMMMMTTVVVVV